MEEGLLALALRDAHATVKLCSEIVIPNPVAGLTTIHEESVDALIPIGIAAIHPLEPTIGFRWVAVATPAAGLLAWLGV